MSYKNLIYKKLDVQFELSEALTDEINEFIDCLNNTDGLSRDCYESEIRSSLNGYDHYFTEEQDQILRQYYCRGGIYNAN